MGFLLFPLSLRVEETPRAIYFLNRAIGYFKNNKLSISERYLFTAVRTNTEIQNHKSYLKLKWILLLLKKDYYNANLYFEILKQSQQWDPFVVYLKILQLLQFREYPSIPLYLEWILNNQKESDILKNQSDTILPWNCNSYSSYTWENQINKNKNFSILWRESLTQKEFQFIQFLQSIFHKNSKIVPIITSQIESCIKNHQPFEHIYHLYRFLLVLNPENIQSYFSFYVFLYQNKKFLETLHIIRKMLQLTHYSVNNKESYILWLLLKKTYQKLQYNQQVDTLKRFLQEQERGLQKTISIHRLKEIASENYQLREMLWFLFYHTQEPKQKQIYLNRIQVYDQKLDYKEKLSLYKHIYQYR